MPLLRRIIGSVLRRIRLAQGRTLQDVSRDADVSLPYLSEIERGRKEASSEILAAICRALGIGLGDLLDEARRELARTDPRRISPRATAHVSFVRLGGDARPGGDAGQVTASAQGSRRRGRVTASTGDRARSAARAGGWVTAAAGRGPRSAARLCGGNAGRLRATVALAAILRAEESFEGTAAAAAR
ncbi:helix-turn-helix domain-containing protein [Catenuloplanes japonicus]|uniref:helix-turn-helix domain-containing protein n=1 Tax=Catenuloplanes japonicus TaxID=33876 RepID=UPI000A1117AD|nr:helix-turn-helix transcriptional regulator [Catenuloplanes japonicus]